MKRYYFEGQYIRRPSGAMHEVVAVESEHGKWVRYDDVKELERLAEIGRYTEIALKDEEFCFASYKGNHLKSFKSVKELIEWGKRL